MTAASVFGPKHTALITGGASGIGLALAQLCRKHDMNVVIVDRSSDALAKAEELLAGGDSVHTYQMDVSDFEQWVQLRNNVLKKFGVVDLLVLNAGTSVNGRWGDTEYFAKTFATNFFGVLHGVNAFLSALLAQSQEKPSAIVITGSKLGITSQPGCPAYSASKSAVKSLAEHLSFDLRNSRISVHLLVPGWTYTSIGRYERTSAQDRPSGAWTPEQVAEYLYAKMVENKFYIICPDNNTNEELDKLRIIWSAGDILDDRPPLSRWRLEYKDEYEDWISRNYI